MERCKNLEKKKNFKNNEFKSKKSGKYTKPCKKPGHDHEWDNCPNNWKNKKKSDDRNKEKHNMEKVEAKSKRGIFDETSDENVSLSDEELLWSHDSNEKNSTNLAGEKQGVTSAEKFCYR